VTDADIDILIQAKCFYSFGCFSVNFRLSAIYHLNIFCSFICFVCSIDNFKYAV